MREIIDIFGLIVVLRKWTKHKELRRALIFSLIRLNLSISLMVVLVKIVR